MPWIERLWMRTGYIRRQLNNRGRPHRFNCAWFAVRSSAVQKLRDRRKAHSLRVASTSFGPHPRCVPDRAASRMRVRLGAVLGCCLADQYWDCRYCLARSRSFAPSD